MVRTYNLSKHFTEPHKGVIKALDGVLIAARPGQVPALVGVNGAGKTTMLRAAEAKNASLGGLAHQRVFSYALTSR